MIDMERKLTIGCGDDYKPREERWINVDSSDSVKKDKRVDLNKFPYMFPDNYFYFIYAKHVLEHIKRENFIKVMKELHRISRTNGILHIICPQNKKWVDPTHKNPVVIETFRYFSDNQ